MATANTSPLGRAASPASLPPPLPPPSRVWHPKPSTSPGAAPGASTSGAPSSARPPTPRPPVASKSPATSSAAPQLPPKISSQDPGHGPNTTPNHEDDNSQVRKVPSSVDKRKLSSVQQAKAPDAKRFKSPMAATSPTATAAVGVRSTGMKLLLSPKVASPSIAARMSSPPAQISPYQGLSHRSKKRRLRSKIWKDFEPIYDDLNQNIVQAKCIHCHKLFKAKRNFGTSACLRHLANCQGKGKMDDMITQLNSANLSSNDNSLSTGINGIIRIGLLCRSKSNQ